MQGFDGDAIVESMFALILAVARGLVGRLVIIVCEADLVRVCYIQVMKCIILGRFR